MYGGLRRASAWYVMHLLFNIAPSHPHKAFAHDIDAGHWERIGVYARRIRLLELMENSDADFIHILDTLSYRRAVGTLVPEVVHASMGQSLQSGRTAHALVLRSVTAEIIRAFCGKSRENLSVVLDVP